MGQATVRLTLYAQAALWRSAATAERAEDGNVHAAVAALPNVRRREVIALSGLLLFTAGASNTLPRTIVLNTSSQQSWMMRLLTWS
jgi:hypothetical protein